MKSYRLIIAAVLAFISSASLLAQDNQPRLEPDRTVKFAERDTCSLYMDIYDPEPSMVVCPDGKERPTVIHVFGGGFKEGSREEPWLRPWFREMNSRGYRMISIDYRLGLKGVRGVTQSEFNVLLDNAIRLAVEDLFAATAYLLENGSSMGIDARNIIVTGSSAGAITAQQAEWEICNGTALASALPSGFNYAGIMAFAGAVLVREPLRYASTPCPVMMFHGTEDELVPYDGVTSGGLSFCGPCRIQKALEAAGAACRFYRFPGINHAVAGYMPQTVDKQADFIERNVMRGSRECVDAEIVDSSLPTYKTGNPNGLYDIQPDPAASAAAGSASSEASASELAGSADGAGTGSACGTSAPTRWTIERGGRGIHWDASKGLPHEDHIEMSGEQVSCVLRWGVDTDRAFHSEKSLVFPMLRTIPNNTHASMNFRVAADIPSLLAVNGRSLIRERVDSVRINGMVEVTSLWSKSNDFIGVGSGKTETACIQMTRALFPSTTLPAVYERFKLRNVTGDNLLVTVPQFCQTASTDRYAGVDGAYLVRAEIDGSGTAWMTPGSERTFTVTYQAYREGGVVTSPLLAGSQPVTRTVPAESPLHPDVDAELAARQAFVSGLGDNLVLETPDTVLNEMFRFAKIRASESIFRTKGGLMHSPGGESYYAAIWANDQAEYIDPFFPFLGYAEGNESALNSFRHFARFTTPDYKPVPSSVIAEGEDIWDGCGDRGDAAMIAYGAARYALARGDKAEARELWPLIQWCLEYCRRQINADGVVSSDTDELENRFESGDANLCTSTLYYDALVSASYLGKEIGVSHSVTKDYLRRSREMASAIERYFGGTVAGYETYRYYKGNTLLRSWICMPLIAGLDTRAAGTSAALTGPELMTENGCLTEQGSDVFWDRATLYALRGIFYTGSTDKALGILHRLSARRLLGDHVPYAVEAWPEGSQRHLSAESGLYCRVITEGLFGIRPTGLRSFTMNVSLPSGWDSMTLRYIRAFNSDFDLTVSRTPKGRLQVLLTEHTATGDRIRTFSSRNGQIHVNL